jgi:hypothetical protein
MARITTTTMISISVKPRTPAPPAEAVSVHRDRRPLRHMNGRSGKVCDAHR